MPKWLIWTLLIGSAGYWLLAWTFRDAGQSRQGQLPGGVTVGTVQVACERAVRDQLVSPSTMRVAGRTNPIPIGTTIRHVLEVDSQNTFGAMLRSQWLCVYEGDRITSVERQR